ncbi:MAG: hypothetical protein ABJE10_23760 [bacterium]
MRAQRAKDAGAQYAKAVSFAPLYADAYYLLAGALELSGDKAGAAENYRKFLEHATRADPRHAGIPQ